MTYKIGDLIRIYFYENVLGTPAHKQKVERTALAIVITEEVDNDGFIQAQYLQPISNVLVANLSQRKGHFDEVGRRITEIVSR